MAVFLLLYIGSFLAVRSVAFKPTIGQGDDPSMYTHESITLEGVDRAAAKFLTSRGIFNTSTTNPKDIVREYFGSDAKGYKDYQERGREFAKAVMSVYRSYRMIPDYTVNSERIREADSLVQTTRLEIAAILSSEKLNNASIELLVDKVGKCLMIIQSFYSNTNWIEINGGEISLNFGTLVPFDMDVASPETVTCRNCDDNVVNSCSDNLLVHDSLTSGYLYGQLYYSKPPADTHATEGKCSHGGVKDLGKNTAATGGINKETPDWSWSPHAHLHNISGLTAVRATEAFFMDATSGLLRGLDETTIKSILRLTKAKQEISMGLVIDVTGSMAGDINSVKEMLIGKLSGKIGTVNEPNKYVLSTFSDPESLTRVRNTTDGFEMIRWIDALTASGGGDCPEYALSGLLAAIKESGEYSPIYLATDADAKDDNMTDILVHEAKAKHIRLVFILTGTCRFRRSVKLRYKRSILSFQTLADSTGGSVHRVSHSEVTTVLDRIFENDFPSSEAIIDYFVMTISDNDTMDIIVDSDIAVLVITISGPSHESHASLSLPNGKIQTFPTDYAKRYLSSNKMTMSIQKPSTGIWKLTRYQSSSWKVNVTASTNIDIDTQLKETDEFGISYILDRNPIVGKNYTLEVLAYNLNSSFSSFRLHLLDDHGTVLYNHPVHIAFEVSKISGYVRISIPSKSFYVQLSGIDQNGFKFKRTSSKLTTPVGVDLFVEPIVGNLDVGIAHNITYKLSNMGMTSQSYTVSIVDDKARVQNSTSQQHILPGGNSTSGRFKISSPTELELITYTVSVKRSGSTSVLQSSRSTAMFAGPICSSFVSRKCRMANTGRNCTLFTWSATAVFSFDISTYMSVKNVSLTIDSTDSKRLYIRGTCCQDNFTVNASSLAGLRCETSQGVVAANHEVVDEVVNEEVIEDGSNDAHRNESESNEEPITKTSSNIGLVVGIAVGSAAVIVAVAVGTIIFKACNGKNNKLSQKDTFQNVDMSTPAYNSAKMHYNYRY